MGSGRPSGGVGPYQTPVHGPGGQVLHQLIAPDGQVDCRYGQHDDVWFLGGTYKSSSPAGTPPAFDANRNCIVPAGTVLYFPVINSEWDDLNVPGLPPLTSTVAQLRGFAKADIDGVQSMFATIDGRPVADLTGPNTKFRVTSPVFRYTIPVDNLFSVIFNTPFPAETVPGPGAVADGAFVMLAPLAPGTHVLHWGGQANTPEGPFSQDITYTITAAGVGH